jgi:hypothetical protein
VPSTAASAHVLTPTPERKQKIPAEADVKVVAAFTASSPMQEILYETTRT